MNFICPVCGEDLSECKTDFFCQNNHHFDKAKSGYVNLLLPNRKNSKIPGDNKLMVNARSSFLEKGYYLPLADEICHLSSLFLKNNPYPNILDAGCGEGYYTQHVYEALKQVSKPNILGIDISKFALNKAAKRSKEISYAVGSIFHLPVANQSCDLLLNLFAPYCKDEFLRVLKADGFLFMIIPGTKHLWELKQAIYNSPYQNEVKDYTLDGFRLVEVQKINTSIFLSCNEDIKNLFTMTPYYYKTSVESMEKLQNLSSLKTKIEFEILVYQPNIT